MNWWEYLSKNPEIMLGKTVIKKTRIPVYLVLEKLGQGYSLESLMEAYPHITEVDIRACLLFAADKIRNEKNTSDPIQGE